ncbi:MAG: sec-independent translocation protein MttA [Bacteroidetes bacterium]|nr:MAG: sec-independent translocation protein MttA [Bacteroidota bacterium]
MGSTEIIFIFVIYLLLFGAKGIPSLAKTMGEGMRHFRSATDDIQREILKGTDDLKSDFKKATDLRSKPNTSNNTKAKQKTEHKEKSESDKNDINK